MSLFSAIEKNAQKLIMSGIKENFSIDIWTINVNWTT